MIRNNDSSFIDTGVFNYVRNARQYIKRDLIFSSYLIEGKRASFQPSESCQGHLRNKERGSDKLTMTDTV
jgi:hypothetical protein